MRKQFYAPTRLSENIRETPEGYLLCLDVAITRTGELVYGKGETPIEPDDNGQVIVTRDAADIFNPKTMASFEGKPITIRHPGTFVTPETWKDLSHGVVQNVRKGSEDNSDKLLADLLITDAIAIGAVKFGLREVSCGYEAEYIETGKGRGRQTDIIGNHLALVEEGRAGETCAINDHKGKGQEMPFKNKTFADKFKKLFGMTVDEAMKEDKEEKKEESKDESSISLDEVKKSLDAIAELLKGKGKDEDKKEEKMEEKAKDEEVAPGLEDRLKALEAAVSKILQAESAEASVIGDEGEEPTEVEAEDEEMEITADEASRAEILSPGIKQTKDMKAQALKEAYKTKDGKKIIEALNGGKAPAFDSAEKVEMLFIAASELMKNQRSDEFSRSKRVSTATDSLDSVRGMTAEQMNEKNAKYYGLNK